MWRTGDLSLAYLTVDGATPAEHVLAAAGAGYASAGVRILPPIHLSAANAVVGNPKAVGELALTLAQSGVRPLDAEVVSLTPEIDRAALAAFVDTAAVLRFRFVQTVVDDTDASRAAENLASLSELAADAGIGVALEFMAFRPLSSFDAALDLIESTGMENIGLVVDALHFARTGTPYRRLADLAPERIALAQLCDAPQSAPPFDELAAEAREGRLHPGEGGLDLGTLLDVLPDGTPLSIEVPHPGFAGRSYAERAAESLDKVRAFLENRSGSTHNDG